jgi:hypothetical protein
MSQKDEKTKVQIILRPLRYCSLIGEILLILQKRDITLKTGSQRAAGHTKKTENVKKSAKS